MTRTTTALAALALAAGSLWTWAAFDARRRPFELTVFDKDGTPRTVRVFDLDPVRARRLAAAPDRARWEGSLELPAGDAPREVLVAADSPTSVAFGDGVGRLDHDGRPGRVTGPFRLPARTRVTITHTLRDGADTHLRVTIAPAAGGEPERLEALSRRRGHLLAALRPWAGLTALLTGLAGLRIFAVFLRAAPPESRARVGRWTAAVAALALTVYGGLLRVEALASKYPEAPGWMSEVVPVASALHPRGMKWLPPEHPYQGDPFSYLRLAREMPGFYAASVREPVFVWTTKQMLRLLGGGDVAVSAASALFSVLLVPATYLLGLTAFSRGVGLLAAAGVAVERQLIGIGVEGWRDDAFAVFVVLATAALLRLHDQPNWRRGAVAGAVLGLALLTRITSLSFAVPALMLIALFGPGPRRTRWRATAATAALAAVLVAPFLIACARAYGDPLHSLNAHTRFYRSRAAGAHEQATQWHSFLLEGRGPLAFLDTGLVGLTAYPFTNKWEHFDYLGAWIGPLLAVAAVVGLLLWPFLAHGRLLLVILFTSLLPYAFTWEIPGGSEWRFTQHAYPFYLVAAASAPFLLLAAWPRLRAEWTAAPRRILAAAGLTAAAAVVLYFGLALLARARVREDVGAGRPTTVAAGLRDAFFFDGGWSWPRRVGHVFVRRGDAAGATVRLPLAAGRAYRLTLRLDSETSAPATVLLNGSPIADHSLTHDERRFGRYEAEVPAPLVREGTNLLRIRSTSPFALWLIHVDPAHRPAADY